jgi:hypothetical protein
MMLGHRGESRGVGNVRSSLSPASRRDLRSDGSTALPTRVGHERQQLVRTHRVEHNAQSEMERGQSIGHPTQQRGAPLSRPSRTRGRSPPWVVALSSVAPVIGRGFRSSSALRLLLLDETSGLLVWARAGTERARPQRPPVRGLGTRRRLGPCRLPLERSARARLPFTQERQSPATRRGCRRKCRNSVFRQSRRRDSFGHKAMVTPARMCQSHVRGRVGRRLLGSPAEAARGEDRISLQRPLQRAEC